MNVEDVRRRVAQIEQTKDDPELAHVKEDQLMRDFIAYIAEEEHWQIAKLAREVLKTEKIKFQRWYA